MKRRLLGRIGGTVDGYAAIEDHGLIASPDGLRGSEGTFTICSFWYVDALARSGRLDDAQLTFEKMLTYSSPPGLYAEEIALTGEQVGNFPQAFSHLALISAAVSLDHLLDSRVAPTGAQRA